MEKDLEVNKSTVIMDGKGGYLSTSGKEVIGVLEKKIFNLEAKMDLKKTKDTQHIKNTKDVLK